MQSVNFKARNRAIFYILVSIVALLYMVAFIRVGGNPFPRKVYAKKTQTVLVARKASSTYDKSLQKPH